jgi:hypothetical protein
MKRLFCGWVVLSTFLLSFPAFGQETRIEQIEREAQEARSRLGQSLDELRLRATPGQFVDQIAGYAREGPVADFLGNLTREMRDNPLPVLLIGIAITWLVVSSSLSARARSKGEREIPAAIPPAPDASPINVAPVVRTQSQRLRIPTSDT